MVSTHGDWCLRWDIVPHPPKLRLPITRNRVMEADMLLTAKIVSSPSYEPPRIFHILPQIPQGTVYIASHLMYPTTHVVMLLVEASRGCS